MAHIISSGETNGIIHENDFMTINNGGVQIVPDPAAAPGQIIYLDFDGELTRYRNADLDLEIDDVRVKDSRLTQERIAGIVAELNIRFSGQNILFTAARPETTAHSTIFVGKTSDFERYGSFAGLAETVDDGNRIKDDNAFVLLDAASADSDIVSTIAHEAGHLLGTLDHGGDGLARYAADGDMPITGYDYYYYENNCTYYGGSVSSSTLYLSSYSSDRTVVDSVFNGTDEDNYISVGKRYSKGIGITVDIGGWLICCCSASGTTVKSSGTFRVWGGGEASDTTVYSGGDMDISNGTVVSTTVNGGMLSVRQGLANHITFNGGTLLVYTGGVAKDIIASSSVAIHLWDGSTNSTTLNSGSIYISEGGLANSTTVNSGRMSISGTGSANSTTLDGTSIMNVINGGVAYNTVVNAGASFCISSGSADNTMVNSGGLFLISSGGTATGVQENGGYVFIERGIEASFMENTIAGLTLSDTSASVHSKTTANNIMVGSDGRLDLFSRGTTNNTMVSSGGTFGISGGMANNTTVAGGRADLFTGGSANNTTVNSNGTFGISGGMASSITIDSDGQVVLSTGTVINTRVNSGGKFIISSGEVNRTTVNVGGSMVIHSSSAVVKDIVENGGYVHVPGTGKNATFSANSFNGTILSGITATLHSGTTAIDASVFSDGRIDVFSGGIASETMINAGGSLIISSGGKTDNTTVNSGGFLSVGPYGSANSTTVNSGGSMKISFQEACATEILENGGYVNVGNGATATFVPHAINGLALSGTSATVHSGTTAIDTTIGSGGILSAFSSGKLTGKTNILSGGSVYAEWYAILDYDISELKPEAEARINNLSLVQGAPGFTLTVSDDQEYGTYTLAGKATDFCEKYLRPVSVFNNFGEELGKLTLGIPASIKDTRYTLKLVDDALCVSVGDQVEVYDDKVLTSSGTTLSNIGLDYEKDNRMLIYSGGVAEHTTAGVNTRITVSSGGKAINTIVEGNAFLEPEHCAMLGGTTKLTGTIRNKDEDRILADEAKINLMVDGPPNGSGTEQHVGYISSLNSLLGATLSITVTGNRELNRSYLIADNATDYKSDVTLTVEGEGKSDVFKWNPQLESYTPIKIGDITYSLWLQPDDETDNTSMYLTIADPISDAAYEYIAHVLAYKEGHNTYDIDEMISFHIGETTYYFIVRKKYDDQSSGYGIGGFDAILLERTDSAGNSLHQMVLGCGGTEQASDGLSDIDPRGIGYHEFFSNADQVYSDCRDLMKKKGSTLSFTGHSLGGALAQWFALYSKERGGIGQVEDVVTFNSPGIAMTVDDQPIPIASSNKTSINKVRHYIGDGDLVSMAGDWFISGSETQYILSNFYSQYYTTHESVTCVTGYFEDQHTTFHFDGNGELADSIKTGSTSELSDGRFSYLTLPSSEAVDEFPNIVSVRNEGQNSYYLFNTQYAKYALLLANGNLGLANQMVTRSGVEDFRKKILTPTLFLLFSLPVSLNITIMSLTYLLSQWEGYDYKKVTGTISVGDKNLTSSDGSAHGRIIRTLSYGEQDMPQLLFDFTNQEFLKLFHCDTTFTTELSPITSNLIIRTVLEEKGDQWICFSIPALDESARYMLVNATTNTGVNLSDANYIRKGDMWYIIDDPATEYTFSFSVDNSVTTEKAVLLPGIDVLDKETDTFELLVSDIDAVGASNTNTRAVVSRTVSVQVKTASNPDGITVELQESDMTGLFRGTVSVSALNLTDEDDHLTIVYEDADNGKGVAETIEKVIDIINSDLQEEILNPPENPVGTAEKVSWEENEADAYVVEYSTDNFEHVVQVTTTEIAVDMPELPAGTYQWRVKTYGGTEWTVGEPIVSEVESATPKVVRSNGDGNDDLFFASPNGTWSDSYYARHVGSVNDWTGTNEIVSANGRGRIQNLFFGSSDPNVLCLTDSENGDAIFVDDSYTELPKEVEENTARLYRIQEIRAGAGDDIVDMTSRRFEYTGRGLTIRGGDGDDVIWANKGGNMLFGDAGNDRIIGASGNDLIAGGTGNDSMHGGGGNDVFTFCDNWGTDTVQQLETGSVTLWFASGDESRWNASTLTYTDGDNSVRVSGVTPDQISLKFGDDGSVLFSVLSEIGAFADFTSQKVFEESGQGLLAGL